MMKSARQLATHLVFFTYTGHTELGDVPVNVQSWRFANEELRLDTNSPDVLDQETVNQAMRRTRVAMSDAVSATRPALEKLREN